MADEQWVLKACPFCGSFNVEMMSSSGAPHGEPGAGGTRRVECDDCGAQGGAEPSPRIGTAWNTRATPRPQLSDAEIERVACDAFVAELHRLGVEIDPDVPAYSGGMDDQQRKWWGLAFRAALQTLGLTGGGRGE